MLNNKRIDKPKVSIIMSNYNTKETFLREAIESILNQTFKDYEFIIIDDNSNNNSLKVIESYKDERIIVIKNQKNIGLASSLNKGLEKARGIYIARMDSDDVSLLTRLEKQVFYLDQYKNIDVLGTKSRIFGMQKGIREIYPCHPNIISTELLFTVGITHPSVMIRKEFLEQNNLRYNEKFKKAQDYELWSRCVIYGMFYEYPEVLLKYRTSNTQATITNSDEQNNFANIVRVRLLNRLDIHPSEYEVHLHFLVSRGGVDKEVELVELMDWCQQLIDANNTLIKYDKDIFNKTIMKHFLVIFLKYLFRGRALNSKVFKKKLFKEFMKKDYYSTYYYRIISSIRFQIEKLK
ncbi:glycosyltransferase family 2 protein [Pseudalkalibacillus hwajinpoensis]|uniref:glycosyltransferase family 2 protein n=1 Tax=Guptibacillus hwajinpoensis TaxID=208199 RepID=UPI00385064C3